MSKRQRLEEIQCGLDLVLCRLKRQGDAIAAANESLRRIEALLKPDETPPVVGISVKPGAPIVRDE